MDLCDVVLHTGPSHEASRIRYFLRENVRYRDALASRTFWRSSLSTAKEPNGFRTAMSDASSSPRRVASASLGATHCSTSVKAFNEDPASNATSILPASRHRDGLWQQCVAPSFERAGDCCSVGTVHGKTVCVPVLLFFLLVDVPFVMQISEVHCVREEPNLHLNAISKLSKMNCSHPESFLLTTKVARQLLYSVHL